MLSNRAGPSSDPSFRLWPTVLCTQVVQAASFISACVPYLRPFLESLESGMIRSDDLRRRGMGGSYGYGDSSQKGNSSVKQKSQPRTKETSFIPLQDLSGSRNTTTVQSDVPQWEDRTSTSSQTRIIRYTTSYAVDSEPQAPNMDLPEKN